MLALRTRPAPSETSLYRGMQIEPKALKPAVACTALAQEQPNAGFIQPPDNLVWREQ
jgi:hypothetical protein